MNSETTPEARHVWWRLVWLAIYAAAMGLLEAVCVIYLRRLFPVEHYPVIPPLERLQVEIVREAATIIMLVAVGWLSGFNLRSRIACFFYAFGIWDIVYYAGLKWLAGWPDSVMSWDCLFLIPKPWYGPVLAPVLISVYFAAGCVLVHAKEIQGRSIRLTKGAIVTQTLACGIWYWSFVKDADWISRKGYAGVVYAWELFALGMIVAAFSLWLASRPGSTKSLIT